jgi:hypothetical protein
VRSPRTFLMLSGLYLATVLGSNARAQQHSGEGNAASLNVNWLYGAYVPKDVVLDPLTKPQGLRLFLAQSFTTPGIYIKTILFSSGDQISWHALGMGRRRVWLRTAVRVEIRTILHSEHTRLDGQCSAWV